MLNLASIVSLGETFTDWWDGYWYGNQRQTWVVVILAAVIAVPVLLAVRKGVVARLEKLAGKTSSHIDDLLVECLAHVKTWFFVTAVAYAAAQCLTLPEATAKAIKLVFIVGTAVQLLLISGRIIDFSIAAIVNNKKGPDGEPDASLRSASGIIRVLAMGVIGAILLLLALDNMGVAVTPLITGLGIGGVAVALASQSILADLFGSISILFDKPFLVGDFIVIGDTKGTVEHIGIKTTRLRALSGEQLVCSNSDLLKSRIQNFKRMQERRNSFAVGITYETPLDMVKRVPEIIREVVSSQPRVRLDRAHFKGFGAYSLDFETVYYMLVPDYNSFMDTQQAINLELLRRFTELKIEFAYPTQMEYHREIKAEGERPAAS